MVRWETASYSGPPSWWIRIESGRGGGKLTSSKVCSLPFFTLDGGVLYVSNTIQYQDAWGNPGHNGSKARRTWISENPSPTGSLNAMLSFPSRYFHLWIALSSREAIAEQGRQTSRVDAIGSLPYNPLEIRLDEIRLSISEWRSSL